MRLSSQRFVLVVVVVVLVGVVSHQRHGSADAKHVRGYISGPTSADFIFLSKFCFGPCTSSA